MQFLIGSGFVYRPSELKAKEFFGIWLSNIHKYSNPKPSRIVVVCVDGAVPDVITDDVDVVLLSNNLGHGHHLLGIEQPAKPHAYSGWSAAALATAMIAYADESDFIWKESDCLCFGPWVQQMYSDLGNADIVFGGPMHSPPYMPSSQSVFLVRHSAIPSFVRYYLSMGDERDPKRLVEHKFSSLPTRMRCTGLSSMFVDRMRPLPIDAPIWSAQQFTSEELDELRRRKLI